MTQQRIDKLLVTLGHVGSRTLSQRVIEAGQVDVYQTGHWHTVKKISQKFPADTKFRLAEGAEQRYVSRAGLKLEHALDTTGLDITGFNVFDVGQSTGGFTDCVLQRGCARVTGVDVGQAQIVEKLRTDTRVRVFEGINARDLVPSQLGESEETFDLVVMDVSFISQTLILPQLPIFLKPGGHLLSLVKPQFEVGPEGIGKGGLVKDARLVPAVEARVRETLHAAGLIVQTFFASNIRGGDGNQEFFIFARKR